MIRVYNTRLQNAPTSSKLYAYDEARRALIREQAQRCGLTVRKLARHPQAKEAFDGDFTQVTGLITQMLEWGLYGLRIATTDKDEQQQMVNYYGQTVLIQVALFTEQAARYQEDETADEAITVRRTKTV